MGSGSWHVMVVAIQMWRRVKCEVDVVSKQLRRPTLLASEIR